MTVVGFPKLNVRHLAMPSVREMLASGYPVSVITDVHREWMNGGDTAGALLRRLQHMTLEERTEHEERAEAFGNLRTWRWTNEDWRAAAPLFVSSTIGGK
ncbi:hypothetical protein [Bradyrhizobium sp. CCBAU 45384]|uniref:hypothetical protein n=1 Tax=Bradyrhizobium sp. CCBAU 45384 TaxID=858428 RepID=UPI00230640EB|nr:hypothetical protein [Bradyrhizobium sp. CCBAU 45384]MDA9408029.1 hypothetical protein [Bradyrhizobium sp. CCBAU 45384]